MSERLRIAIFEQESFPAYGVSAQLTPRNLAADLMAAGLEAELLGIDALADPSKFSAPRFAALILPYGNTYPQEAFANLRAFHQAGGSLITTGIPFTHPVKRTGESAFQDLGHQDAPARWGENGIGVGGFSGPGREPAPFVIAANDPLHLSGIVTENKAPNPLPQWLDPASLPKGIELIPVLGDKKRPLVALLVQKSGPFVGAVDAWAYRLPPSDTEAYETQQVLVRATLAVLGRRGLLDAATLRATFRRLDALPRPTRYANLTLPKPLRRYTTFQPKLPALAEQLVVADVSGLGAEEKVLLTCLQGLVNRLQPRLYLRFDADDQLWLDELQRQGETGAPLLETQPLRLIERFRSAFRGAVLCDPAISVSACVAVSLAGADDLLVVQTRALAQRLQIPIVEDLRGRFRSNAEALRYLRTHVVPRLDPYLTCSLDPLVFDRGGLDHLVATRASVFWITGPRAQHLPGANQAAELEELRAFFAAMPLGAVVRGFWWHGDGIGLQEDEGVALGSRFGKVTLVSDLISNLSVQSGVPAMRLMQKPRAVPPALDPKKVYLAFTMSDGDNLCTWRGYFRRYFEDPLRGTIPIGWGMGPSMIDLAPSWARWYYENATPNDEFICDVSGVAYIYPPSWGTALKDREAAFRWFYGRTQEYMTRMDMKTIRLMDVRAQDIAQVGTLLPQVKYLLPDYGHAGATRYSELTYTLPTGQAVFRAATSGSGPEHLAEQIRQHVGKTRPAFINAFIWNWGSTLADLKRVLELLGPEYVAVTPSQLHTLYRR